MFPWPTARFAAPVYDCVLSRSSDDCLVASPPPIIVLIFARRTMNHVKAAAKSSQGEYDQKGRRLSVGHVGSPDVAISVSRLGLSPLMNFRCKSKSPWTTPLDLAMSQKCAAAYFE